jgi:ligand-binding sensor domain-containing protein
MIDTSNRVKYIGTDIGVFYRDTTMTAWAAFQHGMPVVRVNDLQIDYATNRIWAATYGRSLWESPRQVFYNPLALSPLAPDSLILT